MALAQTRATPDDPNRYPDSSIESLLQRTIGQTSFVSATRNFSMNRNESVPMAATARSAALPGGAGAQREVVDSDVFNLGPAGTKMLVLLNGLRGMMIMNFDRGPQQPVLVGRVPPTGNHPVNMYIDWASNRGIVIENWNRQNYGSGARILTYDLSDLSNPKVTQITEVGGTVNDSRLVGNVLYLVGSRVSDYYYRSDSSERVSYVKSFKISKDGLVAGDEKTLANRADYRENMGISEVKTDTGYKYYVTAITSKDSGWWFTSKSEVEVLDISSPDGAIKPVLVASARGAIAKRSWVQITNGALVVTSNYTPEGKDAKMRVAVETFKLPASGLKKISESEAQFRQLLIERTPEDQREAALNEGPGQLRQVFIENKDGGLRKSVPDFKTLDFGDTTGQNASVQDVRYVVGANGKLQAQVFWVPANQRDPLDIVDVSNPDVRPNYQSRLLFEGWIERSIPLKYGDRNFILGLGYSIAAVDNPQNLRFAQAKLIEVITASGKERALDLATIDLKQVKWSDFNGQDKLVSVNFDSKTGKGSLIFKGEHYDKDAGYVEGGQTVEFNLAAEDSAQSLTEGPFIKGDDGWLRRVFMHNNLNTVMTFSDQELGVFARTASEGSKVVDAINRIELSRNIVAFEAVASLKVGVQIIRKGDVWYDKKASTEIRLVSLDKADAEKNEIISRVVLEGPYTGHHLDEQTGDLVVLTKMSDYSWGQNDSTTHAVSRVYRINLRDQALPFSSAVVEETRKTTFGTIQEPSQKQQEVSLESDKLGGLVRLGDASWAFVDDFNQIWQVTATSSGLSKAKVSIQIPDSVKKDATTLSLSKVEGRLYLTIQKPYGKVEDNAPLSYYRAYIAPIAVADGQWSVNEKDLVNIPGKLEGTFMKTGAIAGYIVSEERIIDPATGLTEPSLNSVALKSDKSGNVAELRSLMPSSSDLKLTRSGDVNKWMFVETAAENSGGRFNPMMGGFGFPGRRFRPQSSEHGFQLGVLDVSGEGQIYRTVRQLNGELTGYSANILKVGKVNDASRIVISSDDKIQVVDMKPDYSLQTLEVMPINTFLVPVPKDPQQDQSVKTPTVWTLPSYIGGYYYGSGSNKTSVNMSGDKLQVALGGYGLCEANLAVPKPAPEIKKQ
jgi:hypothetical protein